MQYCELKYSDQSLNNTLTLAVHSQAQATAVSRCKLMSVTPVVTDVGNSRGWLGGGDGGSGGEN